MKTTGKVPGPVRPATVKKTEEKVEPVKKVAPPPKTGSYERIDKVKEHFEKDKVESKQRVGMAQERESEV